MAEQEDAIHAGGDSFSAQTVGWSQEDFAQTFGVRPEAVSRWETGAERMSPPADRLLRLIVVHGDRVAAHFIGQLEQLNDEASESLDVSIKTTGTTWEPVTP